MYLFLLITSTSWENDHTSLYFGGVDIEYICDYIHTILNNYSVWSHLCPYR